MLDSYKRITLCMASVAALAILRSCQIEIHGHATGGQLVRCNIPACAAVQAVRARAAIQHVIVIPAVQRVIAFQAVQRVIACQAIQRVIAVAAI